VTGPGKVGSIRVLYEADDAVQLDQTVAVDTYVTLFDYNLPAGTLVAGSYIEIHAQLEAYSTALDQTVVGMLTLQTHHTADAADNDTALWQSDGINLFSWRARLIMRIWLGKDLVATPWPAAMMQTWIVSDNSGGAGPGNVPPVGTPVTCPIDNSGAGHIKIKAKWDGSGGTPSGVNSCELISWHATIETNN
jgi:hypothetical protein